MISPRFCILGTAGHVDHGKTTLIKALTGIETDRLPEEKARGLSIDLGFAHLRLPSGCVAGIVDVPGHERFLKNMLAGVGGYDLALLVVDAAEGVMPQTREHMEILGQLAIPRGVVALTKTDLVDEDLLEMAREDVAEYLLGTFMEGAPIIPVSGTTGAGLDALVRALDGALRDVPPRATTGPAYLPIDRVFVKTGFGTVVTGSLWSGRVARGDRLELLPEGTEVKVRGLQAYGQGAEEACGGQRVAVNLGGVDADRVHRGQVLVTLGSARAAQRLDATLAVLADAPRAVRNRTRVRLYCGTEEALGYVVILDADGIEPGREGLVQFVLEQPVVTRRGDRYVLRNSTAEDTLGGGVFLEVGAEPHRRKDEETLHILRQKEEGQNDSLVRAALMREPERPRPVADVVGALDLDRAHAEAWLRDMEERGEVVLLAEGRMVILASGWSSLVERVRTLLESLQQKAPWKTGWRTDDIARLLAEHRHRTTPDVLAALVHRGVLQSRSGLLSTADHAPHLDAAGIAARVRLLEEIGRNEYAPPSLEDLKVGLGMDHRTWTMLMEYMREAGEIVHISKDLWFLRSTLDEAMRRVRQSIETNGAVTAAQARDLLGTTRKYIIPLLEYFDQVRFTRRVGDARVLGPGTGSR